MSSFFFFAIACCVIIGSCSCARLEYISTKELPVYWTEKADHQERFFVEKKASLYFFALLPSVQTIAIDHLAKEQGLLEVSRLSLHERATWDDMLLSVLTLGIYTPRTYTLQGLGRR